MTSTGTTELDAGKTITFTVDTSEAVNAVGSALTLSNGATAAYTSGSGSETLTFSYTVAAGDASTADLKVTGYSGTIADTAGNALAAASVTEDTGVAIITSAPTVTALTDVTSTGTTELDAGKTITFTVDTSEAVNAVGSALTLSNGATAAYTSGSGSETLTFSYTVAAGDASTADLKVTGYSGTIADAAGNALAAASVTEDTGVAIITSAQNDEWLNASGGTWTDSTMRQRTGALAQSRAPRHCALRPAGLRPIHRHHSERRIGDRRFTDAGHQQCDTFRPGHADAQWRADD